MGYKYTIQAWTQHWKAADPSNLEYGFVGVWGGHSLVSALWQLYRLRRRAAARGWGCVTLECR